MKRQLFSRIAIITVLTLVLSVAFVYGFGKASAGEVQTNNSIEISETVQNVNTNSKKTKPDSIQIVSDPVGEHPSINMPTNTKAFIKKTTVPKLKEKWGDEVCQEDFKVLAGAYGSFTRSNAIQMAYLYQYCQKENTLVKNGIVVFEGSQPVENIVFSTPESEEDGASLVFDDGYAFSLSGLRDIDGNGRDELVISYGFYTGGGDLTNDIDILELSKGSVNIIGSAGVYFYSFYQGSGTKITVKSGKTPVFYEESYKQKDNDWKKVGSSKPLKLRKDSQNKYEVID